MHILKIVIMAALAFAVTNLEDILFLILMFSKNDSKENKRNVYIGQFLAFGIILGVSVILAFLVSGLPEAWLGFFGFIPIFLGIKFLITKHREKKGKQTMEVKVEKKVEAEETASKPLSIGKVTSFTLSNGLDNIGIYISIFAQWKLAEILGVCGVFFATLFLFCVLGYKFSHIPTIKEFLKKWQHVIIPVILFGLGILILIDSGTLQLIFSWF